MTTTPVSFLRRSTAVLTVSTFFGVSALEAANIAAQWNFEDAANAGSSVSNVGGFVGTFVGPAERTVAGGGVSGTIGDYALDVRALDNAAGNGAMLSNTAPFLSALNAVSATQAMSITYWEFLDGTPASFGLYGNSPGSTGADPTRGFATHSPWVDGNLYYDTAGCCDPNQRISGPFGAQTGEWQLVSLIYDNGTKTAYRNSTVVASGSGGLPLPTDFDAFFIGNGKNLDLAMDAKLDNFTIWNGALTPQEVADLSVIPVPEPGAAICVAIGGALATLRRSRRSC